MAEKKTASRAEQAVSGAKKKTASGSASKSSGKKSTPAKSAKYKTEYEPAVPPHFLIAAVSILLFALFVVISVNPDGALLKIIQSVVLGLVGQAGFYFAIPGLLYLFVIHTFGRKNAPTMRSVCTLIFVFLCGCIYHLAVQEQELSTGFALIADLYTGGAAGSTGGVLCGGAAMLPQSLLDPVRPMPASIAAEMAEAPFRSDHYYALFATGIVLFLMTLAFNMIASRIAEKHRQVGSASL